MHTAETLLCRNKNRKQKTGVRKELQSGDYLMVWGYETVWGIKKAGGLFTAAGLQIHSGDASPE